MPHKEPSEGESYGNANYYRSSKNLFLANEEHEW
jgi:hypothetical protein